MPADRRHDVRACSRKAGNEIGDPQKIAAVVVDLASRDALPVYAQAEGLRQKQTAQWLPVSKFVDFDGTDLSLLAEAGLDNNLGGAGGRYQNCHLPDDGAAQNTESTHEFAPTSRTFAQG